MGFIGCAERNDVVAEVFAVAAKDVVLFIDDIDAGEGDGQDVIQLVNKDLYVGGEAGLEVLGGFIQRNLDGIFLEIRVPPALGIVGQDADIGDPAGDGLSLRDDR